MTWIRLCLVSGCLFTSVSAFGDQRPPNIVLILADDLGYETVGCYGGTSYGTPRLDALAAQGIRFDHAYAMPLCTNTRIQLMTGRYNQRNWKAFGILDPQEDTFAHMLQRAGYKTCIAGKWQLTSYDPIDFPGAKLRRNTGMRVEDAGFDEFSLWHTGHTEAKGSRYADPVIFENGSFLKNTEGKYGPDVWANFICDFMQRHRDVPFFVYYPMALPHNPMVPTPDSEEWSDKNRRHSDETPFAADMIRYTDKLVGRLVDELDTLGLSENTLVLFLSDNGTNARVRSMMGNTPVRGEKGEGTDLGIRVPMMAYWKGKTPVGKVSDSLIDSVDLLPTIMQIAGAGKEISAPIDGVSFASELTGGEASPRKWVYVHQDPRPGWDKDRFSLIRLARDKQYKLHEDGRLYDTAHDRFERQPIFIGDDHPNAHAARLRLQSVLDRMRPYPIFDPTAMPRPNPTDPVSNYEFHDRGGFVVCEAEMLPTPRDESWLMENAVPDYCGTGFLRSLREQADAPKRGIVSVHMNTKTSGQWTFALRCRADHYDRERERKVWVRVNDGEWMVAELNPNVAPGEWTWITKFRRANTSDSQVATFGLGEKRNTLWLAPNSPNLKIDRVVAFQADQRDTALAEKTPVSPFHPWASP